MRRVAMQTDHSDLGNTVMANPQIYNYDIPAEEPEPCCVDQLT